MYKEIIISAVILGIVFLGNGITESYTKESVDETTNCLLELRDDLSKEEVEKDVVNKKIEEIHDKWDERYEVLAYYLEHDELEKVETELTDVRGRIQVEEYDETIPELDKCVFILEHIKIKNEFSLKNIF